MASEGSEYTNGVAEDLQSAAKGVLEKSPDADDVHSGQPAAAPSDFIQNVAHIVLDKSNEAADSSKAYIENVIHKVQDYAQSAASSSRESTASETVSTRALHAEPTPAGDTNATASTESDRGGLLASVATWCSSLCGSKNINPGGSEPAARSIDFQSAAQNVAQALHSSTATATSSVAHARPASEEPKPEHNSE